LLVTYRFIRPYLSHLPRLFYQRIHDRIGNHSIRSREQDKDHMISYQDGMEMRVGDSVLIEQGRTPGVITDLIESAAERSEWNVQEPGVMIESPPFGLLFVPTSMFEAHPVLLVQRAQNQDRA
jgi:hypothetical protein